MAGSESYNLYGPDMKRGLAYIIANENFYSDQHKSRPGAYEDYVNTKKIFKQFGFKLYPFHDKTAAEILDILKKGKQTETIILDSFKLHLMKLNIWFNFNLYYLI